MEKPSLGDVCVHTRDFRFNFRLMYLWDKMVGKRGFGCSFMITFYSPFVSLFIFLEIMIPFVLALLASGLRPEANRHHKVDF